MPTLQLAFHDSIEWAATPSTLQVSFTADSVRRIEELQQIARDAGANTITVSAVKDMACELMSGPTCRADREFADPDAIDLRSEGISVHEAGHIYFEYETRHSNERSHASCGINQLKELL